MNRDEAIERVEEILAAVEDETMPVPVRELWVYGDVALGLDPVERLDVYVTKDILLRGDDGDAAERFRKSHGVEGVGKTVRAAWAEEYPEFIRANDSGHVAPEKCLAAHLLPEDEPVHLEVCNSSFEDNVTQRLKGAIEREAYEQILDPRGVCLWAEGQRSDEALRKLRESELAFPTLPDALEMLGMDEDETDEAARAVESYRKRQEGATVRGDVV
ncbi:DUF7095 family protein [Halorussus caseinilyticus]|uniref:Uncharacterized protein n=1 Tax=Halorussus caseinilyticus TaxID=3034025 RepID=A0ABD5WLD5_9EURY|nr:hypothetical protein [Halorussus sp. DT72]